MSKFINKLKDVICYRTINKKKLLDQMVSRCGDSECNIRLAKYVLKTNAHKQTLDGVEFYVLDEDSLDIICKYLDALHETNDEILDALTFMRGL